ncbi:hypothetical protein MRX96_008372 [Rhipicephalus microplus]
MGKKVGSPLAKPYQVSSQRAGVSQGHPQHGYPADNPPYQGQLRRLLEASTKSLSGVLAQTRDPPTLPTQKRRKALPKRLAPKKEEALEVPTVPPTTTSACPACVVLPPPINGYCQQFALVKVVQQFNSLFSTSQASQSSYGAPVPHAFYLQDVPDNELRPEAERFVQDVWPE